jgi:hypothetical protein
MRLTFLGKDSQPNNSPTLYATDSDTFVVQGWVIAGDVRNLVSPIVYVTDEGNYIVKGRRVRDPDTLGQMHIPENETCVLVARADLLALVEA